MSARLLFTCPHCQKETSVELGTTPPKVQILTERRPDPLPFYELKLKKGARTGMCACGHEASFHEGNEHKGKCLYGVAGVFGSCSCDGYHSRRRGSKSEQQKRNEANGHATSTALGKGPLRILTAIAQQVPIDRTGLTVLTGYKRSTRDTYLFELRSSGLIRESEGLFVITAEGSAALGDYERLPVGQALREYWLDRLPEGESTILAYLSSIYPSSAPRDDLSRHTGYKRSSRDTYLYKLAARKLVEKDDDGTVRASPRLF